MLLFMARRKYSKTNKIYIYPQDNFLKFNKDEINKTRKSAGLDLLTDKTRQCLRCEQDFISTQSNIRMCEECRKYQED